MYDTITLCLKQKVQLATEMMNCTKQIEVKVHQEQMEISELLKQRDGYKDRLVKCDQLLQKNIQTLPLPEREKVVGALRQVSLVQDGDLQNLSVLQEQFLDRIRKAEEYNREAVSVIQSNREAVKKRLDRIKKQKEKTRQAFGNKPLL